MQVRKSCHDWIVKQIHNHIDEHKKTLDVDNPRDFIDLYIAKELEETDKADFPRKFIGFKCIHCIGFNKQHSI